MLCNSSSIHAQILAVTSGSNNKQAYIKRLLLQGTVLWRAVSSTYQCGLLSRITLVLVLILAASPGKAMECHKISLYHTSSSRKSDHKIAVKVQCSGMCSILGRVVCCSTSRL